jgi:signal transduction protein with GAF and PtsI domain
MNIQEIIDVYETCIDELEDIGDQICVVVAAIDAFEMEIDEVNDVEDGEKPDQDELKELTQAIEAARLDLKRLRSEQTSTNKELEEVIGVLDTLSRYTNDPSVRCEHWKLPAELIAEGDLKDYAYDVVRDLYGELPYGVMVDWESTGDALTQDMTSVEWEGETYWFN